MQYINDFYFSPSLFSLPYKWYPVQAEQYFGQSYSIYLNKTV